MGALCCNLEIFVTLTHEKKHYKVICKKSQIFISSSDNYSDQICESAYTLLVEELWQSECVERLVGY